MISPSHSDTSFFRRVKAQTDPTVHRFVLASDADARRRAVQGALILGIARARGIPAKMPSTLDHGLIPDDVTIVLLDLTISTWGGAVKAAGNISLFLGMVAQDFWALAAHVDAFGAALMTNWRCQADRAGASGGAEETAATYARYRAARAWWDQSAPTWNGQTCVPVTDQIIAFAHHLTLLLGNEHDLRAYAAVIGTSTLPSPTASFYDLELGRIVQRLNHQRRELLERGQVWEPPTQQPETTKFFVKAIEERTQAVTGNTTRVYRRGVNGPLDRR